MTDAQEEHPAAYLAPLVGELRRRATLVLIAFGAVSLVHLSDIVARAWSVELLRSVPESTEEAVANLGSVQHAVAHLQTADSLLRGVVIAILVTTALTAVVFLRWVYRLVDLARVLSEELRWGPGQAVAAFFIPFVSLFRPYQVLFATYTALAPNKLRSPGPRVDKAALGGYRSVEFVEPSPPRKLTTAWIGPWWAAFLLMSVGGWLSQRLETATPDDVITAYHGQMFVSGAAIVAAVFGATVVRGLTARLEERFRRVHESSPESLAERGITVR